MAGKRFASLIGRVYMEPFDSPFVEGTRVVDELRAQTGGARRFFTPKRRRKRPRWRGISTANARPSSARTLIVQKPRTASPKGTAFITDVGPTGPHDSVIGLDAAESIRKFMTGLPGKHTVAEGRPALNAVVIDADDVTGKANSIERVYKENR